MEPAVQVTGAILVTGGMGFIGANFIRYLLREHLVDESGKMAGGPRYMSNRSNFDREFPTSFERETSAVPLVACLNHCPFTFRDFGDFRSCGG